MAQPPSAPPAGKGKKSKSSTTAASPPAASGHAQTEIVPLPEMGTKANGEPRVRGPVEEVIARRMRQLAKKLQRYRTYATGDSTKLNADQAEALKNLPALEGAYKELEDLIREKGPIEEQELIQAAKLRDASAAAQRRAEETSSAKSGELQASVAQSISQFLRLHKLLHPARSEDHSKLTFAPLDLPRHLQDEVQATDVLRVGRMYEDLVSGGDEAKQVVADLTGGPNGADEESDHVHHLLTLLDQPPREQEDAPDHAESLPADTANPEQAEQDLEVTPGDQAMSQDQVEIPDDTVVPSPSGRSREYSDFGLPNGHEQSQSTAPAQQSVLNFLQESELDGGQEQSPIEDGYELVHKPEPEPEHDPAPFQPAYQETSTQPSLTAALELSAPIGNTGLQQQPSRDWADLDDEDNAVTVEQARNTFTSANSGNPAEEVKEETVQDVETNGPAIALVQGTGITEPSQAAGTATTADATSISAPGPTATTSSAATQPPTRSPTRPQGSQQRFGTQYQRNQPRPKEPTMVVDEDGFTTKVRRHAAPPPTRGRGGRGGGEYRGGRGGGDFRGGRGGQRGDSNGGRGGRGGPKPNMSGRQREDSQQGPVQADPAQ